MSVDAAVKNVFKTTGEAPFYDERTKKLLFVDIVDGSVHRWHSHTKEHEKIDLGGEKPVSLIIPYASQIDDYVITRGTEFAKLNWKSKELETLADVATYGANTRFNDGKCDPRGILWAGTMGLETAPAVLEPHQGSLFTFDKDHTVKQQMPGFTLSNGMAWTSDQRHMYFIDTIPRKVYVFDYDITTGGISNQRVAIDFGEAQEGEAEFYDLGYPDGCCIDVEDKLWVACYYAGKVVRFDPETGQQLQVVKMPATRITSCCFGGDDYSEMYVTSGMLGITADELAKQPLAGSVYKISGLGTRGYPTVKFQG